MRRNITPVAAWLASVGVFEIAVAGKPCCYGLWVANAMKWVQTRRNRGQACSYANVINE